MSMDSSTEPDSPPAETRVSVQTPDSALRQPGQLIRDIAADCWAGRELAWRMFLRNTRALYRQTLLGLFWAFLPPLANTAVWVILRRAGAVDLASNLPAGVDSQTFNYALYVVTGMVIWQSFVEALQAPMQAVQANRNLLSKLKFPRESILLMQLLEVLFNLVVRGVVLAGLLWFLGVVPLGLTTLWAILLILLLVLLGFGIGLFLMPVGMLYQDIGRMITLVLPVWMILTPIIYLPPANWGTHPLNYLNPASPLLSVARDLLVFGESTSWVLVGWYSALVLPLCLAGLVVYRLSIPVLVERIST